MIKIILFDIDGVLIRPPHYYPVELEKQGYEGAEAEIGLFYTGGDNDKCAEGKADAEKLIVPYLKKFNWDKTAKEYFSQQFQFEKKHLDQNLLSAVKFFKKNQIKCFTCTDQEKHRAEFLLNELNFKNIFDSHFISCFVGYRKSHYKFWEVIFEKIKTDFKDIEKSEIVFFDDIQNNIDVASKFGVQAFLFTDKLQFEKDLKSLGLNQSALKGKRPEKR